MTRVRELSVYTPLTATDLAPLLLFFDLTRNSSFREDVSERDSVYYDADVHPKLEHRLVAMAQQCRNRPLAPAPNCD